ncbi:MAG: hypothetical protein HFJ86_12205 [Oscillospiraceae bacterium]|jgi:exonuclease SbcD|nr:hypothetical protein [Oscillospiraceae bacterium]
MAIKLLHTGDLHLGSFPGPEKDGQNLRFADICRCMDTMLGETYTEKPDIAVIAGDIFHAAKIWSDRGLKEQREAVNFLRRLSAICPVVVMRGTPNHDSEQQFLTLANTFEDEERVRVVWEPCVLPLITSSGEEISVACLPGFDRGFYRAKHTGLSSEEENEVFTKAIEDMIIGLKAQCLPGKPSVLVSHFTITGANMESGQTAFFGQFEPVVNPCTLAAADFDLVCFGHIHRPQQLEGCKNTFYCGAISQLTFNDEGQPRGYYLHEISDGGAVASTFRPLPTREYKTIRLTDEDIVNFSINGEPDWLQIENCDVQDKVVRVLYDCTDEHNKVFNHGVFQNWLYSMGAFWVQEITPQKITITVDRRSMEADSTPEGNLAAYLTEKGSTPEQVGELVDLARPIISEATEKSTQQRRTGLFVPQEIEVHNYRNYRDESFSFDPIRFCTINGSNGVGKSSLFMDAMLDALFEEPREGDLSGWICNDPEARSGSIKFVFRLGESTYRVTRTRMKSGKATLNISELVDGQWEDRSREKFRDTQQEIENIIGMDSLTLKACALIMQDQYGLFLQADKEARMNILGSILGLGIYGDMEELAADRATETNRSVRTLADKAEAITAGLPDRETIKADIKRQEGLRSNYDLLARERAEAVDGLKVKLNTQLEAAGRVLKLNGKITTLTGQKASKEAAKTSQVAIIGAADMMLSQEAEITAGVARYNDLLMQEKELIKGKATYDQLAAQRQQIAGAVTLNQRTAQEATTKKAALISGKIEPLRAALAREPELALMHSEYRQTATRITELEAAAYTYDQQKAEVTRWEEEQKRLNRDYETARARMTLNIASLKQKVELLNNSGCPDIENATCRFLADAQAAREALPGAEAALASLDKEYSDGCQQVKKELENVQAALDEVPFSQKELGSLRRLLRELEVGEREYSAIAGKKSELQAHEDRLAELETAIADASAAMESASKELADINEQLARYAAANEDYARLQQEISITRQWLDREKQLPVAREQKQAAAGRLLELGSEIEAIEKDLADTRSELAEEQSKTVGVDALKAQVAEAEAEVKEMQRLSGQVTMAIGGLQKQLEQTEAALKEAQGLQDQMNALAGKAAGYEELKKAFSQDGIPHNIIRSIIPIFEATATNILGQMSGGHMAVELITEKALKSNKKKEVTTLDIIINDSDTGRLPYMSRSGGERVKAALSVILALSEIKSSKAGIQLGFLAIDEPPFLDSDGTQAYCTALETIQTRYPDTKILAISHDETFKARFPQSVTVYKNETGSHVRAD